jgi:ADP-heptose:LPS heptosyltransferase
MVSFTPRTAPAPLVAPDLLRKADRILFITHLAIGDFTYMQSCFQALARAFPHLKLHLWVDERRRTADAAAWPHLRKYALYDWLATCPFIDKVYDQTYSPAVFEDSVEEARRQDYPLVVSLTVVDCHRYARLARRISPGGFVVGLTKPAPRPAHILSRYFSYRKLDAAIPVYTADSHQGQHISDIYAGWFAQCFGLAIPMAARHPVLAIPDTWMRQARDQFAAWGFSARAGELPRVVFLNAFSKSPDRTWPLERLVALIRAMHRDEQWRDVGFIVNVVPEALEEAGRMFRKQKDPVFAQVHLFSADEHFFQLPAVMSLCSLVISVETAVMHLANAVQVPVIALMRRNHPEWAPIDQAGSTVLMVPELEDWVTRIGVDDILEVLERRLGATAAMRPVPRPLPRPAHAGNHPANDAQADVQTNAQPDSGQLALR